MNNTVMDLMTDRPQKSENFLPEILMGLSKTQKTIHPKFLYDERGSELFEMITRLPEYYPAHAEREILKSYADEIADFLGEKTLLIEPGSGAGEKIRYLLPCIKRPLGYVAIEISREILLRMNREFFDSHPELRVFPVCADFTKGIDLPITIDHARGKKVIFFPGSTIGNFHREEVRQILRMFSRTVGRGGGLLIGVDLKKEKTVIEQAYNDILGITAEFNLNLLERLNRETRADFDRTLFEHAAIYNEADDRIEMYLKSRIPQLVRVNQTIFRFREGETIHTECSYKYGIQEFCDIAAKSRFVIRKFWTDSRKLFALCYFQRE